MRSKPDIMNYDKHGPSDKCFEGKNASQPCASGSKLCGGRDTEANYVYKITIPGKYFVAIPLVTVVYINNSLHLRRKHTRVFVLGHYLFREANSFQ